MNYRIEDLPNQKVINVKCVKNGSYTILSVEYNDNNKTDIFKMVLEFVSKLN